MEKKESKIQTTHLLGVLKPPELKHMSVAPIPSREPPELKCAK